MDILKSENEEDQYKKVQTLFFLSKNKFKIFLEWINI